MKNNFKIIVRGGYGRTNLGDDALMYTIHKHILNNFDKFELAYHCKKVNYLKSIVGDYKIIPIEKSINNKSEIVIFGGGTQFYSFKKNIQTYKILLSLRLLFLIAKPKELIRIINEKLVSIFKKPPIDSIEQTKLAIGIGIGPFLDNNISNEMAIKKLFQSLDYVAVRDKFSYDKCKEWGVRNLKLYSDLCYALEVSQKPNPVKKLTKILIIIRDWILTDIDQNYKYELIKVANILRKKDIEVVFSIFAKDRDKNWLKLIREENQCLLLWNPKRDNLEGFMHKLNNYDLFVTSRYHGGVFSTILGKPFIAIDIEPKLRLFYELNKSGSELWTKPFNAAELISKLEKITSNYAVYVNNIQKVATEQKELASTLKEELTVYLNRILE